jgi:hypothetical protein
MLSAVSFQKKTNTTKGYDKDTILDDSPSTRARVIFDQFSNAATIYTAKGLKGSKNANFYEFLSMGSIAYVAGSATMIALFNAANKFFPHADKVTAGIRGSKMALGVVLYGVMKTVSKNFINKPVELLTGINPGMPYTKLNYELPDDIYDTDITSIEHHKVFESVEFPRFDLLPKEYYAKIAKKNGHGEVLNDPEQTAKPIIRDVIVKTTTAKNFSSYLWAAVGVGIAMQKPWDNFFKSATKKGQFLNSVKAFPKTFAQSCSEFVKGGKAGKAVLGAAMLTTVLGVINATAGAKKKNRCPALIKKDENCVEN